MVAQLVPIVVGTVSGGTLVGAADYLRRYYAADEETKQDMNMQIALAVEKIGFGDKRLTLYSEEEAKEYFKRHPDRAVKIIQKNPELFKEIIRQNPDLFREKQDREEGTSSA